MSIATSMRKDYKLYPAIAVVGLLTVWQLFVTVLSIPPYMFPGPWAVLKTLFLNLGPIFKNTKFTVFEAIIAFSFSVILAIPVAVAVVWWKPVEKTVLPLMIFLQTVPKIVIAPIFMIWFGFGYTPKILIGILIAYFPVVIAAITGLRDVHPNVLKLAQSMSASNLQIFTKIRIPHSLPHVFSGLKLAALFSLTGVLLAELLGSQEGLGFMVVASNNNLDTELVFAIVVMFLLLGKLSFSIVKFAEKYAISWHVSAREHLLEESKAQIRSREENS